MATLADRVKEVTNTTGTGTLTLAGASSGFQSFTSAFTTGSVVEYVIVSGTAWETGRGTFTASGTTLSRDEVYSSSAAGAKITLTGTSDVFVSPGKTGLEGKQQFHGFHLNQSAPSAITNGLRRVSLDNGANVDLSYDASTRTITLTQAGGIVYWYKGQKVTVASPLTSAAHSATAGAYYFSFDDANGTLNVSGSAWSLTEKVPICELFWNGTAGAPWDERHGANRNIMVHSYLHNTRGCTYASGGVLSGYTIDLGTNAGVQYALTSATIWDEDIRVATTAVTAGGPYTVWYKTAGVWNFDTTPTVPYKFGTNIQYNNAGTLTDVTPGNFVNYYIYAGTSLLPAHQTFLHVGQAQYEDLGAALEEAITSLDFTGFPSPEVCPLYRLTFWCDVSATSAGYAVLVDVTQVRGDKFFNPASNPTLRSPDHVTTGRITAYQMGLNNLFGLY